MPVDPLDPTPTRDEAYGYVTPSQVMALDTGRRYTASSTPNPSQVAQFVVQVAAEIDTVLRRRGYTLPIATTAIDALVYLEQGNMLGANAYIEQSAPGGSKDRRDDAYTMWQDWLKRVETGGVELNAGKDTTQSSMRYSRPVPTAMFRLGQEF